MEQADIEFFKEQLSLQLDQLRGKAASTVSSLLNSGNRHSDPLDRASFDLDQTTLLRIRDRESRLILKVVEALNRIKEGTFGICDECEEEIGLLRMMARPVATLCIRCKTRMENEEKKFG